MKVVLATLNAKYIHSSLALRYLRQYCREVCPDITLKEYTINNELPHILGDIYREKPAVLGLACYIWNIEATLVLAGLVKKVLPQTVIVLGGPEVSYDPAEIMKHNPAVDYIVQGEGEEVLATLLGALRDGWPVVSLPGLTRRYGEMIVDSGPQVVRWLDSLHFPYTEDDMAELKDKIIYYESSRGCPYFCKYCLSAASRGVRFFNLERVLRELEFFIRHDVRQVKFVDRTFNAKREHYWPILRFLAAADCRTNFHFEIAADLLDDEILAFLRAVPPGRFQFEIGVQSTNPDTLQAIDRRNDWPLIVRNVGALMAAGNIHLHLDLIAGLPYEDYRRFGQSFNDVYSLRPQMLQLGFLKLLKGSPIREQAAEHGYVFSDKAPYEVLANRYMNYGDIRRLKIIEELFNQIYNSGRFRAALDWLAAGYRDDAFKLYHEIAAYWEEKDLQLAAHGAKALCHHISDFCRRVKPELAAVCDEFLKYDALNSDRGAIRPEFLPWNGGEWAEQTNSFWRDAERVRKYLPGFTFTTWREIKKNHHIEVFTVNIPAYLANRSELKRERTAILFSYKGNAVHRAIIAAQDFWPERS